jgi:hypothetical protein
MRSSVSPSGVGLVGRDLATCRQHDLDTWLAGGPSTRGHIRPFLGWARSHRHLPTRLVLPAYRRAQPEAPADTDQRWTIARRLVHDDTIDVSDRIAGALVVLYAQPLTRIAALTTAQVHTSNDTVTVALGPDHLELPEPFATLITTLPRYRRAAPAAQLPTPWLFPAARAGQHTTPRALSNRLRRLGIHARAMRHAALIQLAAQIPPALLAGILGIHPTTAVKWTNLSGGNWSRYAAIRAAGTHNNPPQ